MRKKYQIILGILTFIIYSLGFAVAEDKINPPENKLDKIAPVKDILLDVSSGQSIDGGLSWQDCLNETAKNNPQLLSTQEKIKQSEVTKDITASSKFPQLSSALQASTSKASSSERTSSYSYGLSASQLLFDGRKATNEIKAASENVKVAQYNYKFNSSEVRWRLRTAFINLLRAQELSRLLEEILNIRRDNLVLITLRYESGLEHKGALLTAEANLEQAKFEISSAKRETEIAQLELLKEMGRTDFIPLRIQGSLEVEENISQKPDFISVAKNHPSLQKIIAQKNSAEYDLLANKADFFPTVSTAVLANRSGSKWAPRKNQWNLGVTLSLPLFEGGARFARVKQAQSLVQQFRFDEEYIKQGLIVTLGQSWFALVDAIENINVQKKFLNAARERSRIAESQYSLGLINFDNWLIIENDLVNIKKRFLDTKTNALFADADWIRAKGETVEYEK